MNQLKEIANYGDSLVLRSGESCIKIYRPWLKKRHLRFYQEFQTQLSKYMITLEVHPGVELTVNANNTPVKKITISFLPLVDDLCICTNVETRSKNIVAHIPFIEGKEPCIHGYYGDSIDFDQEISIIISKITGYSMYSSKWGTTQSSTYPNSKIVEGASGDTSLSILYTDICMDIDGFCGIYNRYFSRIIHTLLQRNIKEFKSYTYEGTLGKWEIRKI